MFGDQRLEPEYMEPGGGFQVVTPKKAKPFARLPLDRRAFKAMRMIGMSWKQISEITHLKLQPTSIQSRMVRASGKHN
jgi:hypothetical protein